MHDSQTRTDSGASGDDNDALENLGNAEDTGDGDAFDPVERLGVMDIALGPVTGVGDDEGTT